MKKSLAEVLVQLCEDQGVEAKIRSDYRGRGFVSKHEEGFGVVVDDQMDLMRCILSDSMEENGLIRMKAEEFENSDEEVEGEFDYQDAERLKIDSMGLSVIFY